MSKVLDVLDIIQEMRRNAYIWDDGWDVQSGQAWTNTLGASAAATAAAATSGLVTNLNVPTGCIVLATAAGTANSNAARWQTNKSLAPSQDMGLRYACRFLCAQQNTNQVNLFLGLSSTWASGLMQNANAGPNTNFSGAGFYLAGAGTTWGVIVSNGTTQTLQSLTGTSLIPQSRNAGNVAIADGTWHTLEVLINPTSSTFAEVVFNVDYVTKYVIPEWAFTSLIQMGAGAYVNSGSTATNAEYLNVDYQYAQMQRINA